MTHDLNYRLLFTVHQMQMRKASKARKDRAKTSLSEDSRETLQEVGRSEEQLMHRLAYLAVFPFLALLLSHFSRQDPVSPVSPSAKRAHQHENASASTTSSCWLLRHGDD